tara:strand:+ start:2368 stop:2703 length:336 start_codon:yes stop_codon:yes gene_type:complete
MFQIKDEIEFNSSTATEPDNWITGRIELIIPGSNDYTAKTMFVISAEGKERYLYRSLRISVEGLMRHPKNKYSVQLAQYITVEVEAANQTDAKKLAVTENPEFLIETVLKV